MTLLDELDIRHHFGGGVYAKETAIPSGVQLTQHKHKFAHLSLLAIGTASIKVGDEPAWVIVGPTVVVMAADVVHKIEAYTYCVWYCIHATDETDPSKVDQQLVV
jgi:hypothetical protein